MIRRRKFAEMNLWIILIGIVSINYLSRFNKISSVDYSPLTVQPESRYVKERGKKVLVLAYDPEAYMHNQLATPFLNWQLTEEIFSQPDEYANVIRVRDGFVKDPPELIVDPTNVMAPMLERIPELKMQYKKISSTTYARINRK